MPESSTRSIATRVTWSHIEQALLFFLRQVVERIDHLHRALARALAEDAGQHVLDARLLNFFRRLRAHYFKLRHIAVAHVELDHAVVELAFTKLRAQPLFFTRALCLGLRHNAQRRWPAGAIGRLQL